MTSQAFRTALHIPLTDPLVAGNIVQVTTPGENYLSNWASASGLPEAPVDGQQYTRKDGGWVVSTIDAGTF